MNTQNIALLAGTISSTIFAASHIPMLVRAFRTKDLQSYSATTIVLANVGNLIHWMYILNLPFGPIWFLHSFYTITTAIMLLWYVQHRHRWTTPRQRPPRHAATKQLINMVHNARDRGPRQQHANQRRYPAKTDAV